MKLSVQMPQMRHEINRLTTENEHLKPLKQEAAKLRAMIADAVFAESEPSVPNGTAANSAPGNPKSLPSSNGKGNH